MRKTEILPWTSEWEVLYETEAAILRPLLEKNVLNIYHIGSTAIPSVGYAKPIIDLLVVVSQIEKIDSYNEKMGSLGYKPRGENGIPGRRYFSKGLSNRTHHVHMYQIGHENIRKHLLFKEYLLQHPKDAKSYGALKCDLAQKYRHDTHQYQKGKEEFVNELVAKALKWKGNKDRG